MMSLKNHLSIISCLCILLLFATCKKAPEPVDPCIGINCNGFGDCNDGTCECDTGCSGTNCEIKESTKYVGTWTGDVTCNFGDDFSAVLEITNLSNSCVQVNATLSDGFDTFNFEGETTDNNSLDLESISSSTLSASINYNSNGTLSLITVSTSSTGNDKISNATLTR